MSVLVFFYIFNLLNWILNIHFIHRENNCNKLGEIWISNCFSDRKLWPEYQYDWKLLSLPLFCYTVQCDVLCLLWVLKASIVATLNLGKHSLVLAASVLRWRNTSDPSPCMDISARSPCTQGTCDKEDTNLLTLRGKLSCLEISGVAPGQRQPVSEAGHGVGVYAGHQHVPVPVGGAGGGVVVVPRPLHLVPRDAAALVRHPHRHLATPPGHWAADWEHQD